MAWADGWTVSFNEATLNVQVASIPQGITPTAEIKNGDAVVSWGAQELRAGVKMQRYIVTAHSVDETPKPDVKHTVVASGATNESATFTAAELAGGKWKWAITPKFETWVGAEGRLSNPKLGFPATATAAAPAAAAGTTVLAGPVTAAPQPAPTVSNTPVPPTSATDAPPPQPVAETAPTGEATATAGPAPLRTSPPPAEPTTTAVPPPPVLPVEDDLPPPGPVVSSGPTE
ncbi:hypothetical protein ACWKSP_09500 [Micromonosporaceae bacterium Da 78-11]